MLTHLQSARWWGGLGNKRLCKVSDCKKPSHRRKMCEPHYRRWLRTGDVWAHIPLREFTRYESLESELEGRTTVSCPRVWSGPTFSDGFGQMSGGQRPHRVAWELLNGESLGRRRVRQTCGNKLCVTPEHIVLTRGDGMVRRG